MTHSYTFGPVPSRRLGFSLGIDLLPMKTCTYDCIYCQLHKHPNLSTERKSFFNRKEILSEILYKVENIKDIDYLTFSGSGEPTLSSDLGWLIDQVKQNTSKKVAVITNGSLLWMEEVREDLKNADLVVPSIDSVSDSIWRKVNRATPSIKIEMILDGMQEFCKSFRNEIWLEIMIVAGVNDGNMEIQAIADFVNTLQIAKVQLNTVVRPPFEKSAKSIDKEVLESFIPLFKHPTEVIADFIKGIREPQNEDIAQSILKLINRRPCKAQELSNSLAIDAHLIEVTLKELVRIDKLTLLENGYYCFRGFSS